MQKNAGTSCHWLWYICGAKHVIKTHVLDGPGRGSDYNLVVGWTQYYEVMARFGLRHWRRENTAEFAFAEYAGHHAAVPPVCARDNVCQPQCPVRKQLLRFHSRANHFYRWLPSWTTLRLRC